MNSGLELLHLEVQREFLLSQLLDLSGGKQKPVILKNPYKESEVPVSFVRLQSSPVFEAFVSALLHLLHQLSLQSQAVLSLGVRQRGHVFRLSSG